MTPGQTGVINSMQRAGIELTRANYIRVNYAGIDTSNWTFEDETELPEQLQDWSLFKYDRDTDQLIYAGGKYRDEAGNPYHRGEGRAGGQFTTSGQSGVAGERGGQAGKRHAALKRSVAEGTARYRNTLVFSHHLGKPELREARYQQLKREGAKHPGKGYSEAALLDEHGIIHTNDVHDVARALYEGKKVNLVSADKVSVAISHLGEVASRMAQRHPEAPPTFDLCKVTVEDSNLFCVESKGIPRIKMPQLKGRPEAGSPAAALPLDEKGQADLMPAFREHLTKLGYTIEDTEQRADHLKATQNELNGEKVAGLAEHMRETAAKEKETGKQRSQEEADADRLLVSHDDYIVDGHHRWAAKVAIDYDDGRPGDVVQPIARVGAGIIELLALSLKFAKQMGLPQQGVGALLKHPLVKDALAALDLNPDPNWTKGEGGLFTGSTPGPAGEEETHRAWQPSGKTSGPGRDPSIYVSAGDEWNRTLSNRLARDFDPDDYITLDAEAKALDGTWVSTEPALWSDLSDETQENIKIEYLEKAAREQLRSQTDLWKAIKADRYIRNRLAEDFNKDIKGTLEGGLIGQLGRGRKWLYQPLFEFHKQYPDVPWESEALMEAMTLDSSGEEIFVHWDDPTLDRLAHGNIPYGTKVSHKLDQGMRNNIEKQVNARADIMIGTLKPEMDIPLSVQEAMEAKANEVAKGQWDAKPPANKFDYARSFSQYLPSAVKVRLVVPEVLDPIGPLVGHSGPSAVDETYRKTQRLAAALSVSHATKLMRQRVVSTPSEPAKVEFVPIKSATAGIGGAQNWSVNINGSLQGTVYWSGHTGEHYLFTPLQGIPTTSASLETMQMVLSKERATGGDISEDNVRQLDNRLWRAWVGGSTTKEGQLLQYAIADELGGRFNTKTAVEMKPEALKEWADEVSEYFDTMFGKEPKHVHRVGHDFDIGGYEGIKAYIRAKWEVTQYLLEKAGIRELNLFRGIEYDTYGMPKDHLKGWTRVPDLKLKRNGAASATTDAEVANGWGESTQRLVQRFRIPRTAAMSLPAYGINAHNEHEVILIGTAWHGWDVWEGGAPPFKDIPIGTPAEPFEATPPPKGSFIPKDKWEMATFLLKAQMHKEGNWTEPTEEAIQAFMANLEIEGFKGWGQALKKHHETLEGGLTKDAAKQWAVTQDMHDVQVDDDDPTAITIPWGSGWLLYPPVKTELPPLDRSGLDRSIVERKQRQAALVAAHRSHK